MVDWDKVWSNLKEVLLNQSLREAKLVLNGGDPSKYIKRFIERVEGLPREDKMIACMRLLDSIGRGMRDWRWWDTEFKKFYLYEHGEELPRDLGDFIGEAKRLDEAVTRSLYRDRGWEFATNPGPVIELDVDVPKALYKLMMVFGEPSYMSVSSRKATFTYEFLYKGNYFSVQDTEDYTIDVVRLSTLTKGEPIPEEPTEEQRRIAEEFASLLRKLIETEIPLMYHSVTRWM